MPRLRYAPQHLVEGLTFDERLARLEGAVLGTTQKPGLLVEHDDTRARVEELEHLERRRRMPFFVRWFVGRKEKPAC